MGIYQSLPNNPTVMFSVLPWFFSRLKVALRWNDKLDEMEEVCYR